MGVLVHFRLQKREQATGLERSNHNSFLRVKM